MLGEIQSASKWSQIGTIGRGQFSFQFVGCSGFDAWPVAGHVDVAIEFFEGAGGLSGGFGEFGGM